MQRQMNRGYNSPAPQGPSGMNPMALGGAAAASAAAAAAGLEGGGGSMGPRRTRSLDVAQLQLLGPGAAAALAAVEEAERAEGEAEMGGGESFARLMAGRMGPTGLGGGMVMDPKLSHSAPRSPVPSSCRPLSHPTLPSFPLPVQIPGNPTSGDGDAGGKEVEMAEGEQGGREAMLRGQGSLSGGAKMHMGGGRSGGAGKAGGGDGWGDDGWGEEREVVHVRARRGQATDSHSIAERMRREKISDRMKVLQALVPSCAKVTGKAVMLDEIINYVRSLQLQVELLLIRTSPSLPLLPSSCVVCALQLLSSKLAAMDYGNLASLGDPSAFEVSFPSPFDPSFTSLVTSSPPLPFCPSLPLPHNFYPSLNPLSL
ncbi:unnamed protein product [Closterium sp. NIES-54]